MNSHPLNLPPPFSIEELPNLLNKLSSHSNFNAYITLKSPEILETDLSTQRRKSSLSGYTFAVKDNIDVAGFPTTAACPPFLYHPKSSNPVVQALLNAGAICIGKTNLDQFATGLVGTRSPYGIVPNPHNPSLIAGGSSSGSAVAVALDHVHFALATDTAGSGRVPAALNGIISLKPTRGLLSTRGVVPACRSLDCISFFTKSLPLARKLLHFCAFHDPADPWSRPAPPLLPPPPPPWNIGFANPNSLTWENDISSKNAYIQAIQLWQSLGHRLLEINPNPFFEAGNLLYQGPWVAERYASLAPSIRKFQKKSPQYLDPTVSSIILNAENISAHQTFSALHKLQSIQLQTRHIWSKIHFLLFPTIPTSYSIDEIRNDPIQLNFKLGSFTHFLNLLDLCAVTIPFGTTRHLLPTAQSLIAPPFHENLLLNAAEEFLHAAHPLQANPQTLLAVCGAHRRGQPLHSQLLQLGATYVKTTTTAPSYRLFALPHTFPPKPGLLFSPQNGHSIEVEIYSIPLQNIGSLLDTTQHPLSLGNISLSDGSTVKGFLCEAAATHNAKDISHYKSWLHWLQSHDAN